MEPTRSQALQILRGSAFFREGDTTYTSTILANRQLIREVMGYNHTYQFPGDLPFVGYVNHDAKGEICPADKAHPQKSFNIIALYPQGGLEKIAGMTFKEVHELSEPAFEAELAKHEGVHVQRLVASYQAADAMKQTIQSQR